MSAIHQMYCTHCTHGSSALERRQGELAGRMLGYSVRASSLEGDALRHVYRQVERYVSYHLPKDTPGEQKLQLTASTAPQRLIFIPAAGTWQVIGQICYRQRDTEGRPGSYFAHLLCRETGAETEPWTLLDALRLWQSARWVAEDSQEHAFVLPVINDLEAMQSDKSVQVGDQALLAFLRGDDRSFGSRLPDRWRDLTPAKRTEVLKSTLDGLLTVGTTRRQALLVAVEPEVAALLFYAVGRLLPPGKLRASVSMSTFEAAIDRLTTTLAATTFSNPATAEFRGDALRGRGMTLNTFANTSGEEGTGSRYGENMIRRFLEEGPEVVDRRLAMMVASGPERIEALEDFAKTEEAVTKLFHASGQVAGAPWRTNPSLTDFARRLTRERLETLHGAESTLNGLCGSPNHITILELAGTIAPGSRIDRAFRHLLNKLPQEKIAAFAGNAEIDDNWKTELLRSRISATGKTPSGCEWLWDEDGQETSLDAKRQNALAVGVLDNQPPKAVVSLLASLDTSRRLVVVERLLDGCDRSSEQWPVFAEVVRRLDVGSLIALWQKLGTRLFEVPSSAGEAVGERLVEILNSLHEHSSEFSLRLKFLESGRQWLTDAGDNRRLAAWTRCREAIVELAGMPESSGWNQLTWTRRLESAALQMTESAMEAMPAELLEDDRQGSVKQERLRAIGKKLAGGEDFLPPSLWQYEALWKKVGWRIEMGSWPSAPLRKLARGPADQRQMWIAVAIAAVVVVAVLGVIGLATFGTGPGDSKDLVVERSETQTRQETESVPDPSPTSDPTPSNDLSDEAMPADVPEGSTEPTEPAASRSPNLSQGKPDGRPTTEEELPHDEAISEQPVVSIDGTFAASVSPANELKPPAVAQIGLHVEGADGETLPDWVLSQYTIGAVVQEQNDVREARYLDFADLATKNEAELFDGAERVLVQFRFVRKLLTTAAEPRGIAAASQSWAEVPIEPAGRYDIRFALAPSAIAELKRLAAAEE